MQPSQSPKPVAPIRSADTYSPRHSAVTTETKGVISRCQVGPSQAVIVVPDRVDTASLVDCTDFSCALMAESCASHGHLHASLGRGSLWPGG